MNDACMQALGSYEGGRMLYLGLGTGIGSTFITDGTIVPLGLGHLLLHGKETVEAMSQPSRDGGEPRALAKAQSPKPRSHSRLAFHAEYVVIGGGNAKKLEEMPEGCRRGGNHNAYFGGLRMWEDVKA